MERLLRPKEVAGELGVCVGSIYRWLASGHLRGIRLGPNRRRGPLFVRERDFRAFIERAELGDEGEETK